MSSHSGGSFVNVGLRLTEWEYGVLLWLDAIVEGCYRVGEVRRGIGKRVESRCLGMAHEPFRSVGNHADHIELRLLLKTDLCYWDGADLTKRLHVADWKLWRTCLQEPTIKTAPVDLNGIQG